MKQKQDQTVIEAFVFNLNNPFEQSLAGMKLLSQKRKLQKTVAVILELLDAPKEKKI